ncbi:Crossover junction endonuclease mus81 [Blyttiomyces sp. JEL0837]|nr:Crossover junction endonuclease mus81 [Blyttiomyces sp. JEL0837]
MEAASTNLKTSLLRALHEMIEEEKKLALTRHHQSHMHHVYQKAYRELSKFAGPINAPKDALAVKGIGPAIVKQLEMKLEDSSGTGSGANAQVQATASSSGSGSTGASAFVPPQLDKRTSGGPMRKKRVMTKEYVPRYRSAAWSILTTLRKSSGTTGYMTKQEIIRLGQQFADAPLDTPGPGGIYSGWASINTLLSKDLVVRYGNNPPRFALTEEGNLLADRMWSMKEGLEGRSSGAEEDDDERGDDAPALRTISDASTNSTRVETISRPQHRAPIETYGFKVSEMRSGTPLLSRNGGFDIILILDNREKNSDNRKFFQTNLTQKGIKVETKTLELGDVMWIARANDVLMKEVVLNYIVERKTMDDLVASIKDGRFKEQKVGRFRLSECKMENVIYLLEASNVQAAEIFGYEAVFTAMTQTQVDDGFFLKVTTSPLDTVNYLANLTKRIISNVRNKNILTLDPNAEYCIREDNDSLLSVSLERFNAVNAKTKNFTLNDVWIRQLLTIPGLSPEKATAIAAKFPTSRA